MARETKKLPPAQRRAESRKVAEEARETRVEGAVVPEGDLPRQLPPRPRLTRSPRAPLERPEFRAFMERLERLPRRRGRLRRIDRDGKIPPQVIARPRRARRLRDQDPEGVRRPRASRSASTAEAIELVTSKDGSLDALLSAHQSIGVPQPLKLFGTPEQKKKYFPRLARGAISAFALTEPDVGLRSRRTWRRRATPTPDGRLRPERREALVHQRHERRALRRDGAHPEREANAKQITAFIVESDWPGVEVVHRCHFMGLKAIENGVIRFTNVRVPRRTSSGARARASSSRSSR